MKKAAVVIGVNNTGNLIALKSAAKSANEIAEWLSKEDFDVELITDENNEPVTSGKISDAINKFVTEPPRYHQLLIYFSGHGYWQARGDYWLLSKAPTQPQEAINLNAAMDYAKFSGIPNVVFISDACRSIPDSRSGIQVSGIPGFPSLANIQTPSKVDYFKATSEATSAFEVELEGESTSVLTHAFTSAYKEATPEMVKGIGGQEVIPNRRLESFLQSKVNTTLAKINPGLRQIIEVNVPSSDDTYIAKYSGKPHELEIPSGGISLDEIALNDNFSLTIPRDSPNAIERTFSPEDFDFNDPLQVENPETEEKINKLIPSEEASHFETECGFLIVGATVTQVSCIKGSNNASVELLDQRGDPLAPIRIRVVNASPEVSVLIRLSDGRGIVMPALSGYIGNLYVNDGGLQNASFVPSSNNWRWSGYQNKKLHIDRFRALTAIAVENNIFKLPTDTAAITLANKIRIDKAIDPTLGLYAAHAYYQAGKDEEILSVKKYMGYDINAVLFDIHVMTSLMENFKHETIIPFCPLLTQTWNLIHARNIEIDPLLIEASRYLTNALWTTFEDKGANLVQQYIDKENLKGE